MGEQAAKQLARDFLTGLFDMVANVTGQGATFDVSTVSLGLSPEAIESAARDYGAAVLVATDMGGVGLLLPAAAVRGIAAAFTGEEPDITDPVGEAEGPGLLDVFEPCIAAGLGLYKERYGRVVSAERLDIAPGGERAVMPLVELLSGGYSVSKFSYSAPSLPSGEGAVLLSRRFEQMVGDDSGPTSDQPEAPEEALGSDAIDAILGSVGLGADQANALAAAAEPAARPGRPAVPPNLDMILDLRLVVRARLGRVEMPIGEILALGPGSILDVGHLVEEPVELLVNDKLIARGDVVVVDEKFGLRITEIVSRRERIESLR